MGAFEVVRGSFVLGPGYRNVRSDECSAVADEGRARDSVWFRGVAYRVVGLYFARAANGQRELRYVLGPMTERDQEHGVP